MTSTIISLLDISAVAFMILYPLIMLTKGYLSLDKNQRALKVYLQGAAYGISRHTILLYTSLFTGTWYGTLIKLAATALIFAVLWYTGMHLTLVAQIVFPVLSALLYFVPQPKMSALDKMSLDLTIRFKTLH